MSYKYHSDLIPTIIHLKNTKDFYQLECYIDPFVFSLNTFSFHLYHVIYLNGAEYCFCFKVFHCHGSKS